MPRDISYVETGLIQKLKEYWTYQKHYYADRLQSFVETYFGAQALLEDFRDFYFKNENNYATLALQVARLVCLSSDNWWDFSLVRHGHNTNNDTSFYLRMIVVSLEQLGQLYAVTPPYDEQYDMLPENLRKAIELVKDEKCKGRLDTRKEQLAVVINNKQQRPTPSRSRMRCAI